MLAILSQPQLMNIIITHYNDGTMGTMASQITSLKIVFSTVYSGPDQRKHNSSASLAFVQGIHRGPVNSPHKWPVTRKMFPFDGIIMNTGFMEFCFPTGPVSTPCYLALAAHHIREVDSWCSGNLLIITQMPPLWHASHVSSEIVLYHSFYSSILSS